MKKLVGIISACLMLCTAAFAEGYFSAEDQEKGTITEDKAVEDGFVLHATTEKYMNITKKPLHKAANGSVDRGLFQRKRYFTFSFFPGKSRRNNHCLGKLYF